MDIERMKRDMKQAINLAESADERDEDLVVVDVNLLYGLAVDINMLIQALERCKL